MIKEREYGNTVHRRIRMLLLGFGCLGEFPFRSLVGSDAKIHLVSEFKLNEIRNKKA